MKRKIAIATVTTAALLGGGAAFAAGTGQAATSAARTAGHDDHDDDDAREARKAQSARTTAAEAAEAALKAAPGTVTSIDLLDDAKGTVWEVDLTQGSTSHEVRLDADTNKVLRDRTEKDGDKVPDSKLTAADVARKAADRGTVTAVESDDDTGAWTVETAGDGKETELTVDGRSGKITQSAADHHEDDGEDDGDGQDDDKGEDD
jgi:uncharacterized membrane protein YkoI